MTNKTNITNIRDVRDQLAMSQADFAAKLGVDQSTISLWEKNGPPKRGLIRAALESKLAEMVRERTQ